ncbi:hypothetical protein BG015_002781 [Linnemannia schmuckeri]|uniref:tRNA-splicing endonuclease subunit Sen54 N-terminal domain-containing protein n=1 Tax=Linnemannia schmuckeri TaxID=64567 RepID=A0A9P5RQT6_9FUNG|nr:hypothetical protein BG015_002781 [Linnemannia schmuckeri]
MDRYLAYAYLKRLGYVVTRPGTYDARLAGTQTQIVATPASSALSSDSKDPWLSSFLWRLLVDSWNSGTRIVLTGLRRWFEPLKLGGMMQGLVDPAQAGPSSTPSYSASAHSSDKGKKMQQPDWPKVLFAVVDGGQVSFMSLSNVQASL